MSRNVTKNRTFRKLRQNFQDLEISDFVNVFENYCRLKKQYKIMQICKFIEKINIPVVPIPILRFFSMLLDFIRWVIYDILITIVNGKNFSLYGLTIYCGRQGGGKTISMVKYLDDMRQLYPNAIIVTNFGYIYQDMAFTSWNQFLTIRNGEDGVIFAIDEIQNEYNSTNWKDFPESLLSTVTQQRKQRIKIVATSQVFTRVVKQLREQCYEVVECKTFGGRWTKQRCYDADDYNSIIDNPNPEVKFKTPKKWKKSFIQSNYIRDLFDSYSVVERMQNLDFIERKDRNV